MCGIIGAIANPRSEKKIDANEFIINQFEDQNSRGKEGFGIIRITNGKIDGIDRACTPMKFLIDLYQNKAESIIAHHRTPTSTDNKIKQTHPIFVSNPELKYDYLVIHNGMIRNNDILKAEHEKLGYKYTTESIEDRYIGYAYTQATKIIKWNDSETLAIDLARYIEKKQTEIKIEGSAAFIAIQTIKNSNKITKIFFGRRDNPININIQKEGIYLSSEGIGEKVPSHNLYWINISKPTFDKENNFIIRHQLLKFEDERLEEEKEKAKTKEEKKKEKEIIKQNTLLIENFDKNKEIKTESNQTKIKETTKIKEEIKEEIKETKDHFETQIQAMEEEYWEKAKTGIERGSMKISEDCEEGIDQRNELINEIIKAFVENTMEPGYCKEEEKGRKGMTLGLVAKILLSIENIANYESFNLEQLEDIELEKMENPKNPIEYPLTRSEYDDFNNKTFEFHGREQIF